MSLHSQQSYREATVRGANPVTLVIRLYEQVIEDMRQVAIAIDQKDIGRRSNRIKHALLVVGYLQSVLDFERGGKVARDLDNFYNALRENVMWVQFHPSKRAASQVITDLLALREAWIEVDRSPNPKATTVVPTVSNGSSKIRFATESNIADRADDVTHVDWEG